MTVGDVDDDALRRLGEGEQAAIALALSMRADLMLIDECKATAVAVARGFAVTGTLGILRLAARRSLIDLTEAIARLRRTNLRYREEMLDGMLSEVSRR